MNIEEIVDIINNISLDGNEAEGRLTQKNIEELITCTKFIFEPEKINDKFINNHNQKRFKVPLYAKDFPHVRFSMDIRESTLAPENSSVILTLYCKNKNVCLFRCNGPHNEPNGTLHTVNHSHTMQIDDLMQGRFTKPAHREKTNYTSLSGAVRYFINKCNIMGAENLLPLELGNLKQISMEDLYER